MDGFSSFFTPLDKQYCLYFYWLSVIGFVFVFLTILTFTIVGLTKKVGIEHYLHMISLALGYLIFGYFQNPFLQTSKMSNFLKQLRQKSIRF